MNKLAGLLGVLAIVAVTPLVRADFQISINGTTNCTPTSGTNPSGPSGPNGSLTCAAVTVAPGVTIQDVALVGQQAADFSQQLGTTLLIQNTTSTPVIILIGFAVSNFTSPITPPTIIDSSGVTINVTTGNNSVLLISCVDQSNGLVAPTNTFCTSPAGGAALANPLLSQSGAGTNNNTVFGGITALHAPFSLTQLVAITAGANSNFNITTSQVLTPIPEPASILLLGSALLGITLLVRKKVARRPAAD